jgi:hypothetical protein
MRGARAVVRDACARVVAAENDNESESLSTQIPFPPTLPNTSQNIPTPPTTVPSLPSLSQNSCTTQDYNNTIPENLWHIGTGGAILVSGALIAPETRSAAGGLVP